VFDKKKRYFVRFGVLIEIVVTTTLKGHVELIMFFCILLVRYLQIFMYT